jgi:hypothetical protein
MNRLTRSVLGVSLILGSLIGFVGFLLTPGRYPLRAGDAGAWLDNVTANTVRWEWSQGLLFLALMALIGIIPASIYLLHERSRNLGLLAGAIAFVGVVAQVGYQGFMAFGGGVLARSIEAGTSQSALIPVAERLVAPGGYLAVLLWTTFVGMGLGFLLIGIALARSRTAPRWAAVSLSVGAVALVALGMTGRPLIQAIGFVVFMVGLIGIGLELLTTRQLDCETIPEYQGWRGSRPHPVS